MSQYSSFTVFTPSAGTHLSHYCLDTISFVSRAIMISSFVGMTYILTVESSVLMRASLPRTSVALRVEFSTEVFQAFCNGSTVFDTVFADASREGDDVYAAHSGCESTDFFADLIMEHVEGELSAFIAFLSCFAEVAEVAGYAGNAEDAGFLIHERIHFFRRKVVVVHDVEDDSRVDIAAAGAHEDAGERCKP